MKLNQKIAFIQNSIDGLSKDGKNTHFKNGYVTLNQVIEALRVLEVEQGISITMPLCTKDGRPAIALRIEDLSTEEETEIESVMVLPDLQDPQKMGSAITYYRRYMLMSFFNLKSEDDDAEIARPKPVVKAYVKPEPKGDMAKVAKANEDEEELAF